MKGIAFILSACLLILNLASNLEGMLSQAAKAEMECCCDKGSTFCNTDGDQQDESRTCSADQDCTTGCDCTCGFHFTAARYGAMEHNGIQVKSFHYVNYRDTYSFEYSKNFLRPPRTA